MKKAADNDGTAAAILELARVVRMISHGELHPMGLEGLTMVVGGDPAAGAETVASSLGRIADAIGELAGAANRLADAVEKPRKSPKR